MKSSTKSLIALMTSLAFVTIGQVSAQTFKVLHSFTSTPGFQSGTNSDGGHPFGGLVWSGNTLYGAAQYGGSLGAGTLFQVNRDGTGFAVLHNFLGYQNSDGTQPMGSLILSGNTIYGTTSG